MSSFNEIVKRRSICSLLSNFNEKTADASKTELRKLEQRYLKPEKLPPYTGQQPTANDLKDKTVKLVFPDRGSLHKFEKHFPVRTYKEQSVTQLELLLQFLDLLEEGKLHYDKKHKSLTIAE